MGHDDIMGCPGVECRSKLASRNVNFPKISTFYEAEGRGEVSWAVCDGMIAE